jgi:hypothetical protein
MSAMDESNLSALRENIERKGTNSYYYAHGHKADGPKWDGNEAPRLLEKTAIAEDVQRSPLSVGKVVAPGTVVVAIDNYAWLDEKKNIKIYVDFDAADTIPDEDLVVSNTPDSIEFAVTTNNNGKRKMQVLKIDRLHYPIVSVSYKKKSDKFVLALKKEEELTWYDLKKRGGDI